MQTSADESQSLLALARFLVTNYPARTFKVVLLLFLAGLAEGIGVVSILPLLGLARGIESRGLDETSRAVLDILRSVGLDPSLGVLLGVIVVGISIKSGLTVLAGREAGYATSDMGTDLRLSLIRGLMRARWDHFTSQLVGRHANAVGSEALRASSVFENATRMVANTFQVLLYAAVALVVAPIVTLGSLVFGLAIFLSLSFLVRMAREAGRRQTRLLQILTVRLTESLSAIKPLKAMAREKAFQPLLEQDIEELNKAQRKQVLSNALLPSVQEPLTVLILAIGAFVYLTQLRVGLEQFIFMAFLFYRTVVRLGNLQIAYQKLAGPESALAALRGAIASAHQAVEHNTGMRAPTLREDIRLDRVSLSYGPKVVFTDLSVTIPARRITAIIGPSGVGKTSLADLIVGLVRPSAGRVLLDGRPLDEIDIKRWRSVIGYVPQETFLFHDSVYVNVALNDPDISRGDVERALRLVEAWDFVCGLERGMESVVGERGSKLSGGQRQRIAFARALLNKPELLILDEATAALDPITEKAIWKMVRGFTEHCTVLAISHQTALMDVADVVIKLDSAEVAGPQEELVKDRSSQFRAPSV